MSTYYVTFINKTRITLREEFIVSAASRGQALLRAQDLLSRAGKRVAWYQKPTAILRGV